MEQSGEQAKIKMINKGNNLFISSYHPLISRNILQTDVLGILKGGNWDNIFVLCPKHKENYFKGEFENGKVQILPIQYESLSKMETRWKELGNSLLRTSTIRNNRKERREREHNIVGYFIFLFIQNVLSRFGFLRKIYQKRSISVFRKTSYLQLLDKYQPVVFSTDVFHDEDVRLLASAKGMGLKTVGMVRSWDNCTNKGILPIVPDIAIAHNEVIANELVRFHGVNEQSIKMVGIPQFDYYVGYVPADESFFAKTGFVKGCKTILFAPTGSKFVDDDWFILDLLIKAIADGRIPDGPQILVRFPPGDEMKIEKANGDPKVTVYVDRPGVSFSKNYLKDREMSKDDMKWLVDSLYWSDLLVSVGSTLCIDIAVFDKPIIMPNIQAEGIPYSRSMRKIYKKYHLRHLLLSNACDVPKNEAEFIDSVIRAISNPERKSAEREELVKEQALEIDGNSSRRLADIINAQ